MAICSICGSESHVRIHHLSYSPEITTPSCASCHLLMHNLARKTKEQQDIIISWVKQYGDLWVNCFEQYKKSERQKEYNREYNKSDKYKEYQRIWKNSERGKKYTKDYKKKYYDRDEYRKKHNEQEKQYRLKKKEGD